MWGKEGSGLRAMLISSEITLRVRFGLAWGVSTRFNLPPKPSSWSSWSAWVTALFGRFGAVTNYRLSPKMKFWKCFDSSWQNQFLVCGLHSCQWSVLRRAPIKQSSRLRTIFSALAPVFSNLRPAVWKSFQAPLRKSERRRSSVSVKAIYDGQIFRVWKGKSEKGVFTYANLTGWDWDSLPQWSHVKFLVHVLYIGGWSEVNNVIYAGNRIMW